MIKKRSFFEKNENQFPISFKDSYITLMRISFQILLVLICTFIGVFSFFFSDIIPINQAVFLGIVFQLVGLLLLQNLGGLKWSIPIEKGTSSAVVLSFSFLASQFVGGIDNSVVVVFYSIALFWNARNGLRYSSVVCVAGFLCLEWLIQMNAVYGVWSFMPIESQDLFETLENGMWTSLAVLVAAIIHIFVAHPKKIQEFIKGEQAAPRKAEKITLTPEKPTETIELDSESEEYDKNQWQNSQSELAGLLDSVVFFMSKNFKNHSSLAFVSLDQGETFSLNSCISKNSDKIIKDVKIIAATGIVGKAAEKENGFMSGNLANYPDIIEYYSEQNLVKSVMISPIRDEKYRHVIGLLVVDGENLQNFSDENKELLNRFTRLSGKLIANATMGLEIAKNSERNEKTYKLSKKLAEQLNTSDILKIVIHKFQDAFHADRLVFCDYNPAQAKARILKIKGESTAKEGGFFGVHNLNSMYAQVFKTKKPLHISKVTEQTFRFNSKAEDKDQLGSLIIAPITDADQNCIAVVGLESKMEYFFSNEELMSLNTLTMNASSALEKAKLFMKMEKHATIDGLTQIPNHRYFQDLMDSQLAQAARSENGSVSLLLMDIDHFKNFNDTYGHPLGDEVLRQVAQGIKGAIRTGDHVARYGGEEFVVILHNADAMESEISAERIRKAVEAVTVDHNGKGLKVTVSVGAATYPDDAVTKAQLIENSDRAMYFSKEHGRNRVTLFKSIKK